MSHARGQLIRLDAARMADGAGRDFSPGSMVVERAREDRARGARDDGERKLELSRTFATCGADTALRVLGSLGSVRVLAIGRPTDVDRHEASADARRVDLGRAWLVPAFVNAHAHLDLTHMGTRELESHGFEGFIAAVRVGRCVEEEAIAASVMQGVALSRQGGVVAVGDIGGAVRGRPSLAAWRALRDSGMRGVSFLEFFAAGRGWKQRLGDVEDLVRTALGAREWSGMGEALSACSRPDDQANIGSSASSYGNPAVVSKAASGTGVRLGLQPHAPYSVCQSAYAKAIALAQEYGTPLCTHLAESMPEREYVANALGPFRALLESLGLWEDSMLEEYGRGRRPIDHMKDVLAQAPMLAVHLNDVNDAEMELLAKLAETKIVTVVYCPRASDYFGAAEVFGPHRYREMMRAGIRVVLGTDSIVSLPRGTTRITTLDEVVYLCRRDKIAFAEALGMATWKAAEALGVDSRAFRFEVGHTLAGLVAVDGADEMKRGEVGVRVL